MEDIILKIDHVSKFYPGVVALNDVSMTINKGEVRALVGENGAGKSTLIKCIMGVEKPDEGAIYMNYDGNMIKNTNALEAQNHGMFANWQHVNIAPYLSIAENYYLGRMPKTKIGTVDWRKAYSDSQKIIDKFELGLNPKSKISELPLAMQAMITISKISVNDDIRVVIFDEPTALLENQKVETLFKYIEELKNQGVSIIYISHRLEEIMEICDSVTILKDGTYVDTKPISEVTKDSMISMMVGREMSDIYNIDRHAKEDEVLRVENFSDGENYFDIDFSINKGEILGFFGLVGAGRSEIMRGLCGIDPRVSGEVYMYGEKKDIRNPREAMLDGIGFLTEDRRSDGVALQLPIKQNINMNSYHLISKSGFINLKKEQERAIKYIKDINIKTPTMEQQVGNLSGGNQQKVVIGKILCTDPDVLIFDEPTVGVDVGAKEEIYKIMERLAADGKAIILISSYLPEVMGLSDRLIVMSHGRITAEYNEKEIKKLKEEEVLRDASVEDVEGERKVENYG